MRTRTNERVAWFNGVFIPESEVRIPFRDSSWVYGDGAFDMTRSFGHRLFKVKEHVDRLYRSLRYLPNIVLECSPLPLVQRAKLFKEGIRLVIPSHRRVPPDSLTPRAKTHNYLNLIVANQETQSLDPEAWALLLDVNGNLCEGMGSNIFIVRDGEVLTPREKFVLPGISRQTVIELARQDALALREADIDLYDAYNADEIFLTSTSLCMCPVTRVNGLEIGPKGQVWGPVTKQLAESFRRLVDCDFVGQYLKHYVEGMQARAF